MCQTITVKPEDAAAEAERRLRKYGTCTIPADEIERLPVGFNQWLRDNRLRAFHTWDDCGNYFYVLFSSASLIYPLSAEDESRVNRINEKSANWANSQITNPSA